MKHHLLCLVTGYILSTDNTIKLPKIDFNTCGEATVSVIRNKKLEIKKISYNDRHNNNTRR
jgi:hypothetical protein